MKRLIPPITSLRWPTKKLSADKAGAPQETSSQEAAKKTSIWNKKRSIKALQPQTIILGSLFLAGAIVVVADFLPYTNEPAPGSTDNSGEPAGEPAGEISLLPADIDMMLDPGIEGQKAAEQALSFYNSATMPRLGLVDADVIRELSGRSTADDVVTETTAANEFVVQQAASDNEQAASFERDGLLNRIEREQARAFGLYGPNELRPGAIEGAVHLAKHLSALATYAAMETDEIVQLQDIFRESSRFSRLIGAIGHRVGQNWQLPRQRLVADGAVIELELTPYGDLLEASIDRSTGNVQYDDSVIAATQAAAPFYELNSLEPWLRPVLMDTKLTFGSPPLTPEEHRRRRDAGTLHTNNVSDDELDSIREMLTADHRADYYSVIRQMVENEFLARSPGSFSPEHDAIIRVEISPELGVVMALSTEKSSGDPRFDEAAHDAIDAAAPFRGARRLSPLEQERLEYFKLHFYEKGVR